MKSTMNANAQAVLACVQKENRATIHPTALEVYEDVKHVRPHIGLASVYRILHQLVEANYLKEVRDGEDSCRYDGRTARHDHAICIQCGVLIDLPSDVSISEQILTDVARAAGLELDSHEVRLYGRCSSCQAHNLTHTSTNSPVRSK